MVTKFLLMAAVPFFLWILSLLLADSCRRSCQDLEKEYE